MNAIFQPHCGEVLYVSRRRRVFDNTQSAGDEQVEASTSKPARWSKGGFHELPSS